MAYDFSGKRALVTGAGKGIGRATALRLALLGADVFALSRTQADLESLREENPKINTICVDLSDWTATREAVSKVTPIQLLVNNAAVVEAMSMLESTPEAFDTLFNINVKAVMNVSQVMANDLIKRNMKGSIVNLSSVAGLVAVRLPVFLYSGTKGAIQCFTKAMAVELSPKGIRVNCVNPTLTWTDMARKAAPEEHVLKVLERTPMGRVAELDDVVNSITFLLSDQSDMVNGHILPVDGGYVCN